MGRLVRAWLENAPFEDIDIKQSKSQVRKFGQSSPREDNQPLTGEAELPGTTPTPTSNSQYLELHGSKESFLQFLNSSRALSDIPRHTRASKKRTLPGLLLENSPARIPVTEPQ